MQAISSFLFNVLGSDVSVSRPRPHARTHDYE